MKPTVYDHWLAGISGLSSSVKIRLNEIYPDLKELFMLTGDRLDRIEFLKQTDIDRLKASRNHRDLESDYRVLEKTDTRLITWRSIDYPYALSTLNDQPFAVYVKGALPPKDMPMIAMVGARTCSAYGRSQAKAFASHLASHGVGIISGMALGIDGIAQRAALSAGGYSLAVLGCGAGICYPQRNKDLYDRLTVSGGILSEYPLYEKPLCYHFPQRNRLISVLSDAVLVIEAREKSGSLITADFALEQGRDVYALPGPVDSSLSKGCHNLIAQGAVILRSPDILLSELGFGSGADRADAPSSGRQDFDYSDLNEVEIKLMSALSYQPVKLCQLEDLTQIPADKLAVVMMELQLKGLVTELSRQHYVKS